MTDVTAVYYRHALEGELPPGRIADIRPGEDPSTVAVIIAPGHATAALLSELGTQQNPHMITGQWCRLPDTPANRVHPQRVWRAGWQLMHPEALPEGILCLSVERSQRHDWIIREGHASPLLVAEMTWLLTRMVRRDIWIQRGTGEDAGPTAA
ncbi:hypothetical protein [Streptomyces thermolilacinus]|uniref:hypothetical protein n=1 Tax=Streptomyces thermolilacinus TaxID=285540 RepID=UPI0033C71F4E